MKQTKSGKAKTFFHALEASLALYMLLDYNKRSLFLKHRSFHWPAALTTFLRLIYITQKVAVFS